jgi:hypothetical protein
MYELKGKRIPTWNPFVGCEYDCVYCYAPKIYKMFSKCEKCQRFIPHFHKERLKQKFKPGETWFVCSMGDISFASFEQFNQILEIIGYYPETTFYIQSKNPAYFNDYIELFSSDIRSNVVLGTTIESNYHHFISIGSVRRVSKAPPPVDRKNAMIKLSHHKYLKEPRKYIIIEPAQLFDVFIMTEWIKEIAPEFVYIGYDNHRDSKTRDIPEPSLEHTERLMEELSKFTDVRIKTIRKAWWEK